MMNSETQIEIYEEGGSEPEVGQLRKKLSVKSHWNVKDFVVLKIGKTSQEVAVAGEDLKCAIDNAMNVRRH